MNKSVKEIIDGMTIEQKVGQLFTFGFAGIFPHPDIMEGIEQHNAAAFRVTPTSRKFKRYFDADHPGAKRVVREPELHERDYVDDGDRAPRVSAEKYAEVLNEIRQRSIDAGSGIPVYFSLDFEGNQSCNAVFEGIEGIPHPMGLVASGDAKLVYDVANRLALTLSAIGFDVIHSPVLDVNTDPRNPEIGARSFSPDPEVVAEYATHYIRGLMDGGIIPVGKHFPGRGHSAQDAHFDVPVIDESLERMEKVHLYPYKELIKAGLPAVMLAHTVYPALDPSGEIATLSKPIITGTLREKLGFEGVVTTDSFTMGGLVSRYEVLEAAVRTIEAGVDLILLKDDNALRSEVYHGLIDAVESGRLTEERVEESVERVLKMKEKFGILDTKKVIKDAKKVPGIICNKQTADVLQKAAEKTILELRSDGRTMPVTPDQNVLIIEEKGILHKMFNDEFNHAGALYEAMARRGFSPGYIEFDSDSHEKAWDMICRRAPQYDVIVHTGYYNRGTTPQTEFFARFKSLDKPTVFVTNSPYSSQTVTPDMQNVLVIFTPTSRTMDVAADVLTGKKQAGAKLGFDPDKAY